MLPKKIFILISVALLLVLVSAYSGAATAAAPEPKAAAQATEEATGEVAPSSGEPVTINWWHIWANQPSIADTFQKLADEYMAEHPNVTIKITTLANEAFKQKISTVMQSGEPPDIFQSWGGGVLANYAKAGLVQDLTPYLAKDGWGDSIAKGSQSLFMADGKNYAVPFTTGMAGIWYNKDLFKQAGIEKTPETWDEFLTVIQQLKDAGITPITVGAGDKWPGMFWFASALAQTATPEEIEAAVNRTGSFDSPGFVAAGDKVAELVALEPFQEGYLGATYPDADTLMANNLAAMQLMGQWDFDAAKSLAEDVDAYTNYMGWFPFPKIDGAKGEPTAIFGGGDSFAVGKNAPPRSY